MSETESNRMIEMIDRMERMLLFIRDILAVNHTYWAALEFYADKKSWCDGDNSSPIDHDQGWKARHALRLKKDQTREEYQKMMAEFEKNFREKGWDM